MSALTEHDRSRIEAARRALADAESVNLLDGIAMARVIGRLEVAVERLIEMTEAGADTRATRCPAAHREDPAPCGGPIVVTIVDETNAGADGCEVHAVRMLASLTRGRPVAKPDAPQGVAVRVFRAAQHTRPFPWVGGRP
ncbi:hypothetical protein [Streptomyces sp. NPDC006285]|uniref:hypothetical protein n=1 Tax=Streptomyces sp. NPDC006285 TaxID=3364742 RepID=UPI00368B205B